MSSARRPMTWFALVVGTAVWSLVSTDAQTTSGLNALTVPAAALPQGCRLKPADGTLSIDPRMTVVSKTVPGRAGSSGPPALSNPWIGQDRPRLAEIRQIVDGMPQMPDGPPLDRQQTSVLLSQQADHVVDAYRAWYVSDENAAVDVFALRFDNEQWAAPSPPAGARNLTRGVNRRIVRGATVVFVSTAVRTPCFDAIEAYLAR